MGKLQYIDNPPSKQSQHGKSFNTEAEAILFSQKYPIHWIHRLWEGYKGSKNKIGWHVVWWI